MGRLRRITLETWLELAVVVGGFIVTGIRAEQKIGEIDAYLHRIEYKFDRIEKYLSSKDVHYWETIRKLEEPVDPTAPLTP